MPRDIFKIGYVKFAFCHRRPDRTLRYRGKYFPVCARCTGIYIGMVFAFSLSYFLKLNHDFGLFFISLIFMLPAGIDGVTQLFKWRESRNSIRLVTGLFCGIGYGLLLILMGDIIGSILP